MLFKSMLIHGYNANDLVLSSIISIPKDIRSSLSSSDNYRGIGSKRHSIQAVELSQRTQAAVQIVSNLPTPSNWGPIYRFLGMPAMWTRCNNNWYEYYTNIIWYVGIYNT